MQTRAKRFLWLAIILIVAGAMGWLILGGKSTGAAEKYKAELRAKGERVSFADLGFPKTMRDSMALVDFTNTMQRIHRIDSNSGRFVNSSFKSPDRCTWTGAESRTDCLNRTKAWPGRNSAC